MRRGRNLAKWFCTVCLLLIQTSPCRFPFPCSSAFTLSSGGPPSQKLTKKSSPPFDFWSVRSSISLKAVSNDELDATCFPEAWIQGLDLKPIFMEIGKHTGTRRGYQAFQEMVSQTSTDDSSSPSRRPLSRRQRAEMAEDKSLSSDSILSRRKHQDKHVSLFPLALTMEQARQEYNFVEEATLALSENPYNVTFPPLYGVESNPFDTDTMSETDDDEWLYLPADAWTLEHLAQAEQVLRTLLRTKAWAVEDAIGTWLPNLSKIAGSLDSEQLLPPIFEEISGLVEIVRVRSLSDPEGKSSFTFRLKTSKFPVLKILREKEEELLNRGAKAYDREAQELETEIENVEAQIRSGLAQLVLSASSEINHGLALIGRLDAIMAKAAFGYRLGGKIPLVSNESAIQVEGFLHPFLSSKRDTIPQGVIPIDLNLACERGKHGLIISGPNGGGKTLAMKAFGLVSVMMKSGIPIPVKNGAKRPRIDFVDDILINLGDSQSLAKGESTWTALLNSCSRMIQTIEENPEREYLILLDELGSGTDPEAGGAMAQALLEEFLSRSTCRLVATTHSPRLKALSYDSDTIGCATVLMAKQGGATQKPTFRLEYGVIGESYAIAAASRCSPSLPPSIISRASMLLEGNDSEETTRTSYMEALTKSTEAQLERANSKNTEAMQMADEARECRRAMKTLAASYELELRRLEQRLDGYFQKLKVASDKPEYEVVGETLVKVKLVKKEIQTQQELLKERGLKILPPLYELSVGETVVVVSNDSEMDGSTVEVIADAFMDDSLKVNEVLVSPSSLFTDWDQLFEGGAQLSVPIEMMDRPWIFSRQELAVWDYDSIWEDETSDGATSVASSTRRLNTLLSTLPSTETSRYSEADSRSKKPTKVKKSFASARARKAANKQSNAKIKKNKKK